MEGFAQGVTASDCRSQDRNPDLAPEPRESLTALLEVCICAPDKTHVLWFGASPRPPKLGSENSASPSPKMML